VGFPDLLDLAWKVAAVIVPLVAALVWYVRWRRHHEEDQLIELLEDQRAAGRGNGFAPELGSRVLVVARRCAAKRQLERVGDSYFLPGATTNPW